ncbi:transcription termination factor NusG [Photorhabdus sp. RM71S]|uniref:transcription termination factor NusG n=1 Tax=Photorhabdus sp. RM71S TaxID=3342824 RepID=UPI0036D9AAB2
MKIEHLHNQQWYLAQYITGGKNREHLFDWLSNQHMVPWTPLTIKRVKRSDKLCCYRKRIAAVFPGYFFLKANFDIHNIATVRCHSAFCDFVHFGGGISPVRPRLVEALMKTYPEPELNPAAKEEIIAASDLWLTKEQYNYLLHLEEITQPISRISMLYKLVFQAEETCI